jgi:plastocyanin
MFTGQTTPRDTDREIHITSTGPAPVVLVAEPGDTLTWINDDQQPHIVTSQTLMTSSGTALYSTAIFPGNSYQVTIAPTAEDGANEYTFTSSPLWKGHIVVAKGGCPPKELLGGADGVGLPRYNPCRDYDALKAKAASAQPFPPSSAATASQQPTSSAPAVVPPTLPDPDPVLPPIESGITNPPAEQNPADANINSQEDQLPYNPYTVVSDGAQPNAAPADGNGSKKPPSQPGSGPEVWVTVVLALCTGAVLVRRHLCAFEIPDER